MYVEGCSRSQTELSAELLAIQCGGAVVLRLSRQSSVTQCLGTTARARPPSIGGDWGRGQPHLHAEVAKGGSASGKMVWSHWSCPDGHQGSPKPGSRQDSGVMAISGLESL